jgi:hypothetical protein
MDPVNRTRVREIRLRKELTAERDPRSLGFAHGTAGH